MALGTPEIVLIVAAIILLFGAPMIPKLARGLGQAKGEFNKAKQEFDLELNKAQRGEHTAASEQQIRQTARELGIAEAEMSLDEVKAELKKQL